MMIDARVQTKRPDTAATSSSTIDMRLVYPCFYKLFYNARNGRCKPVSEAASTALDLHVLCANNFTRTVLVTTHANQPLESLDNAIAMGHPNITS